MFMIKTFFFLCPFLKFNYSKMDTNDYSLIVLKYIKYYIPYTYTYLA